MRISKEHLEIMQRQIELDCNIKEATKIKEDIYISPTRVLPGSRIINKTDSFFRVVVFMGTAYIMADEETIPGFEELFRDYEAEWFFSFNNLRTIDHILKDFDREIVDTRIYFLPDGDFKKVDINQNWKLFTQKEIDDFREGNPFPHALCYSKTQPDIYALAAPDNKGGYAGMAGASIDGKYVCQIGIDVNKEYRGRGLASSLVAALKQEIIKDGYLPFYGTASSHALSRHVAVKSGFLPAFSELVVKKTKNQDEK